MSNILLIGGGGFIGIKLAKQLALLGNNIWIFEKKKCKITQYDIFDYPNIFIQNGDLCDINGVVRYIDEKKINIVIHLASTLIPASGFSDYEVELEKIILPTVRLLPIFSKKNIKLVFFSSGGTVYGNNNYLYSKKEIDKTEPICYYGESKLFIEEMIRLENLYSKLDYLIIRPSNPYGPGQNIYGKQGLIAIAIGKMLKKEPLQIWGDGCIVRDYIYIDDLVNAVCDLITLGATGIFNVGSGLGYTINQIVDIINEITPNLLEVEFAKERFVDIPSIILDVSKLKEKINFIQTDIHEGISQFILAAMVESKKLF